ncbi:MAG: ATP-dependent zinc protease [Pirellula sp.]|jgi:ribosomal protein S6--L-glutamate ligase
MSHFVPSSVDWSAQSEPVDELLLAGWCESVSLPGLGIEAVVAKLDTGAVVSSLHATQIEYFSKKRCEWVRFRTIDMGAHTTSVVRCEARLLSKRSIRSSNGSVELRPVVETSLYLGGFEWTIELSLNDRSQLECPLLLGRSALQSRCLIDCSRRFVLSTRIL